MPDHFEEEVLTEQGWVALQRGWRQPKKSKKTKKQSLGTNVVPKDFLQGIVFFWAFFSRSFWFLTRKLSSATGLKKNQKTRRKSKNTKKSKSWERCCTQRFPPGDCLFVFVLFCFVLFFLSKFFVFWFMILCGICVA